MTWCPSDIFLCPLPCVLAEDDGWLLVYVHDSVSNQSSLNIYDAKTMNPEPLARVLLPQRVPFGECTLRLLLCTTMPVSALQPVAACTWST